jgi:hypothetical protein
VTASTQHRALVTIDLAALHLARYTGRPFDPALIRKWASRGEIGRHGKQGRLTLYDVDELERAADRRELTGDLTMA